MKVEKRGDKFILIFPDGEIELTEQQYYEGMERNEIMHDYFKKGYEYSKGKGWTTANTPKELDNIIKIDIRYENQAKALNQLYQEGAERHEIIWILETQIRDLDSDINNPLKHDSLKENKYYKSKLKALLQRIKVPHSKKVKMEDRYNFDEVKKHIETLQSDKEKITYLIDIKAEYNQNRNIFHFSPEVPFGRKCDLEIERIKELANIADNKKNVIQKSDLAKYSNSQIVLIFFYFFKFTGIEPRVTTDIAPIAKFLHLITSKNFSKTPNSDFYKKLSQAPNHVGNKQLLKDLKLIKPLFADVELNEIVKMIDNEIDLCQSEIKREN